MVVFKQLGTQCVPEKEVYLKLVLRTDDSKISKDICWCSDEAGALVVMRSDGTSKFEYPVVILKDGSFRAGCVSSDSGFILTANGKALFRN